MDRQLDRVVLASPDGLAQNIKMPSREDELFQRLQAMIDKDPDGRSLYPDAAGLINRVLNRLAMQPVRVSATRAGGEPVTFVMGAWEVRLLTAVSLADPSTTVRVLAMFRAADAGDYRPIAQQVYNLLRSGPYLFGGMRELVDAASGVPQDEIPRIEEQARTALLGDLLNFPVLQLLSAFGPLDLGDSFRRRSRPGAPGPCRGSWTVLIGSVASVKDPRPVTARCVTRASPMAGAASESAIYANVVRQSASS
jgi:hypothetical protein